MAVRWTIHKLGYCTHPADAEPPNRKWDFSSVYQEWSSYSSRSGVRLSVRVSRVSVRVLRLLESTAPRPTENVPFCTIRTILTPSLLQLVTLPTSKFAYHVIGSVWKHVKLRCIMISACFFPVLGHATGRVLKMVFAKPMLPMWISN